MNPNKVYSRENLLNLVWGYEYPGDVRTVDVHVRRLREKIEPIRVIRSMCIRNGVSVISIRNNSDKQRMKVQTYE